MPVFEYPRDLHKFGNVDKKETRQKIQRVIVGKPAFDRYESYECSDSYAKCIKSSIGRYQALNIVIFQTLSKDFDDYYSVMWCLSGILKPTSTIYKLLNLFHISLRFFFVSHNRS